MSDSQVTRKGSYHGKIILDAVKEMENPPHVILTSTELADVCSDRQSVSFKEQKDTRRVHT